MTYLDEANVRPLGVYATQITRFVCPLRTDCSLPVAASHRRTVSSRQAPAIVFPFGRDLRKGHRSLAQCSINDRDSPQHDGVDAPHHSPSIPKKSATTIWMTKSFAWKPNLLAPLGRSHPVMESKAKRPLVSGYHFAELLCLTCKTARFDTKS